MVSKGRPGGEPDPRWADRPGQGGVALGARGPEGWPAPGPDEPMGADPGLETGTLGACGRMTKLGRTARPVGRPHDVAGRRGGGGRRPGRGTRTGGDSQAGGGTAGRGVEGPPVGHGTLRAGRGAPGRHPRPRTRPGGRPCPSGPYGYEDGYPTRLPAVPRGSGGARTPATVTLRSSPSGPARAAVPAVAAEAAPRRANGPWPELVMITAVAVIIAAVILAVTSADRTNLTNSQSSQHPRPAASRPDRQAAPAAHLLDRSPRSTSTVPRAPRRRPERHDRPPANQKAKNLLVTPGVENSLVRVVAGHQPGRGRPGPGGRGRDRARPGLLRRTACVGHILGAGGVQTFDHLLQEASTAAGQQKLAEFHNDI